MRFSFTEERLVWGVGGTVGDYKEREAAPAAPRIGFGCIEESIFWLVVLRV